MVSYKETICFVGGDSVGKTTALLEIAKYHPNAQCIFLDFENKYLKIKDLLFPEVNNVTFISIDEWKDVQKGFDDAMSKLGVGDWLLIDGLDKAWDIIQSTYDPNKHGANEWGWIKGEHNKDFLDKATGIAPFNVAATAYAQPNADFNIQRESDRQVQQELLLWKQIGFRPGGEKRNTSRFDTVFALKAQLFPRKNMVTTFKDKMRPYLNDGKRGLWLEFEFPFWETYKKAVDDAIAAGEKVVPLE